MRIGIDVRGPQNFEHFLEQIRIHTYFLNKLSMCLLAWYVKATQPQNMTFSQRKDREQKVF